LSASSGKSSEPKRGVFNRGALLQALLLLMLACSTAFSFYSPIPAWTALFSFAAASAFVVFRLPLEGGERRAGAALTALVFVLSFFFVSFASFQGRVSEGFSANASNVFFFPAFATAFLAFFFFVKRFFFCEPAEARVVSRSSCWAVVRVGARPSLASDVKPGTYAARCAGKKFKTGSVVRVRLRGRGFLGRLGFGEREAVIVGG